MRTWSRTSIKLSNYQILIFQKTILWHLNQHRHLRTANTQNIDSIFDTKTIALITGVKLFQWITLIIFVPCKLLVWFDTTSDFVKGLDLIASFLLSLAVITNFLVYKHFRKSMIFIRVEDLDEIAHTLLAQGFELTRETPTKRKYRLSINPLVHLHAVIKTKDSQVTLTYPEQLDPTFDIFKQH